jgi:ERCC4-type nuclease
MLPMIGPKLAKTLLNHFGTIEKLAAASEDDLKAVSGLGEKRAKLIRALICYEYRDEEDKI